jgi:hypothetical protein
MKKIILLIYAFSLFFIPSASFASGAIKTNVNGIPLHWDRSTALIYNPEGGSLKSTGSYNRAASLQLLNYAFGQWANLPNNQLVVIQDTKPLNGIDVNPSNLGKYFNTGIDACYDNDPNTLCLSPVVFDEDGEIIDKLFGTCAKFSILGFAGFNDIDDGTGDLDKTIVRRGQALFSGACIPDSGGQTETKAGCQPCKRVLTDEEIRTIVTHEVGHLMGMDHSQVNPKIANDCQNPDGCPVAEADGIPTMYPILLKGATTDVLHEDDKEYFLRLYGDTSNTCSVSGSIFANDGTTPVRGVEVVARNTNPNQESTDALAFISGAEAPRNDPFDHRQGNCKSNCGDYLISNLKAGQSYQICVQRIDPLFTGGSSIEPVDPPFESFSEDCPSGLTVSCDCSSGCEQFTGKDVITDADPNSIDKGSPSNLINNTSQVDTGGCSLAKPRTEAWTLLKKALVFTDRIL